MDDGSAAGGAGLVSPGLLMRTEEAARGAGRPPIRSHAAERGGGAEGRWSGPRRVVVVVNYCARMTMRNEEEELVVAR